MSVHTKMLLTQKKEIIEKIEKIDTSKDLALLNSIIDKMFPEKTFSKEEVFGNKDQGPLAKNGRYLKSMRLREGYDQVSLCKKLKNIKQPNISAWENGREPIPNEQAKALSKILKCELKLLTRKS
ncbi:MAG: helix-turn-helix transcriptional regulator [Bacteriovoracaceae bacterium]|nr:helix-turn-helix transcriptional regulator [Bacteriovoracaceae bacterium]